jgi:hypothetical protein
MLYQKSMFINQQLAAKLFFSESSTQGVLLLPQHYGSGVDLASNENKDQESAWGKERTNGWTECKADNLTAICEPIV